MAYSSTPLPPTKWSAFIVPFVIRHKGTTILVYTCKKLILRVGLASELNVLANLLSRIALADRHTCDFTSTA